MLLPGLLCGISFYSCRHVRYLDTSIHIIKEIIFCVWTSIFIPMNNYLRPKLFGPGEEISPKIDSVRIMNVQKWTETIESMLKGFSNLLNLFKHFQEGAITVRPWEPEDPADQKECNSSSAQQNNLENMPFATSKRVISGNQRSCFHSSDINLTFSSYPDNFVCHVILKATTRNQ